MPRPKRPALKRRLTELTVRKLKPKRTTYLLWDTLQRGLAIRVQPTGARAWKVIYSRHGRPRWLHLGDAGAIGLADARTLAAEAMLAVARGKDPAAEKRAERGAGTFADLASRYVEHYAKKRNKSWKQADALVQRYLLPRWGKLQAASITRGDVRTMMSRIEAPVLANQVLAAASAIFSWATKQEIIAANPCRGVERNETGAARGFSPTASYRSSGRHSTTPGWSPAPPSRWSCSPGRGRARARTCGASTSRTGGGSYPASPCPRWGGPAPRTARATASGCPRPHGSCSTSWATSPPASCSPGRAVARSMGSTAPCGRPASKLGVERATPHDLRRTFSTKVTGLGFGREALNRITNHKEGGITDVYDRHGYAEENMHIMETVAAHIVALVEGRTDDKVVPLRR